MAQFPFRNPAVGGDGDPPDEEDTSNWTPPDYVNVGSEAKAENWSPPDYVLPPKKPVEPNRLIHPKPFHAGPPLDPSTPIPAYDENKPEFQQHTLSRDVKDLASLPGKAKAKMDEFLGSLLDETKHPYARRMILQGHDPNNPIAPAHSEMFSEPSTYGEGVAKGLYENFVRPLTSPVGIGMALMGGEEAPREADSLPSQRMETGKKVLRDTTPQQDKVAIALTKDQVPRTAREISTETGIPQPSVRRSLGEIKRKQEPLTTEPVEPPVKQEPTAPLQPETPEKPTPEAAADILQGKTAESAKTPGAWNPFRKVTTAPEETVEESAKPEDPKAKIQAQIEEIRKQNEQLYKESLTRSNANPLGRDLPTDPNARPDITEGFGGSGHPEDSEYVGKVLKKAGTGDPGLSVEPVESNKVQDFNTHHIVYRSTNGDPIAVAKIVKDPGGKNLVMDLAVDKTKGLLSGRAMKAVGDKLEELGATEAAGTISPDAQNFLDRRIAKSAANKFADEVPPAQPGDLGRLQRERRVPFTEAQRLLDQGERPLPIRSPNLDPNLVRLGPDTAPSAKGPDIVAKSFEALQKKTGMAQEMPPEVEAQIAGAAERNKGKPTTPFPDMTDEEIAKSKEADAPARDTNRVRNLSQRVQETNPEDLQPVSRQPKEVKAKAGKKEAEWTPPDYVKAKPEPPDETPPAEPKPKFKKGEDVKSASTAKKIQVSKAAGHEETGEFQVTDGTNKTNIYKDIDDNKWYKVEPGWMHQSESVIGTTRAEAVKNVVKSWSSEASQAASKLGKGVIDNPEAGIDKVQPIIDANPESLKMMQQIGGIKDMNKIKNADLATIVDITKDSEDAAVRKTGEVAKQMLDARKASGITEMHGGIGGVKPSKRELDPNSGPYKAALDKLFGALDDIHANRDTQDEMNRITRAERFKEFSKVKGVGAKGAADSLRKLRGEYDKINLDRTGMTAPQVDSLFTAVKRSAMTSAEKARGYTGLFKIMNGEGLPERNELAVLDEVFGNHFSEKITNMHGGIGATTLQIAKLANTAKALENSFSLAAPLRHGFGLMYRKEFYPAIKEMFKFMANPEYYEATMDAMKQDPDYILSRDSGLFTGRVGHTTATEEEFLNNYAQEVPIIKDVVGASARGYTGFLAKLRFDTFKNMVATAKELGADISTGEGDEVQAGKSAKAIARYINTMTGRGDLGKLGAITDELNTVLWSPRMLKARLDMFTRPSIYMDLPKGMRMEGLKSLLAMGSFTAVTNGLMQAMGAKTSYNPLSTDFMKARFPGKQIVDPGGGIQQYLVAAAREFLGKTDSKRPTNRLEIAGNFLKNKESPAANFVHTILTAKKIDHDYLGDPVKTRGITDQYGRKTSYNKELGRQFAPIFFQDLNDILTSDTKFSENIGLDAVLGAASLTGMYQTYPESRKSTLGVRKPKL